MTSHFLRRTTVVVIPVILCIIALAATDVVRRSSSITYDETFYLRAGERTLQQGTLDADLARLGVAPLPILLNTTPGLWLGGVDPNHDALGPDPKNRRLIDAPRRLTTWTSLLPLIILSFGWLYARRGLLAATAGTGMIATSPSLLAHASLATTDAPFAFLATLAALAIGLSLRSPGRTARLLLAATATGMAFSAKYTGVLLIPCYIVARSIDFLRNLRSRPGESSRGIRRLATEVSMFLVVGFAVAWACHGFQYAPGSRIPALIRSLQYQIEHNKFGHPSFYLGERSKAGWWSYYPFTMLAKSTLPELLVALCGAAVALATLGRRGFTGLGSDRERATLLWFAIATAAALISSPICIGHRYTLTLYPVLILLSIDAMADVVRDRNVRYGAATALLGCQFTTAMLATPDYLAYFNPLTGGPDAAWRQLADSNIDWGQDLPALETLLNARGFQAPILDYFGTASPTEYGIQAEAPTNLRYPIEHYDALAVSVTKLHSVYARRSEEGHAPDVYRRLRQFPPSGRAGRSILVYDLRTPGIRDALLDAIETAGPLWNQAAMETSDAMRR